MVGRPNSYTKEAADCICSRVSSSSDSLRLICLELSLEYNTVKRWLVSNEEFRVQYVRAKEEQADHMADEIISIADDSSGDNETRYMADGTPYLVENKEWTSRSKLRVEARKWIAMKLKPKKYGDKIDITGTQEVIIKVKVPSEE